MRDAFVPQPTTKELTSDDILGMFQPLFTDEGANQRQREEDVMDHWVSYLDDVGKGKTVVKPKDILRFASGLNSVPLIGWGSNNEPTLQFLSDPPSQLPQARTCGPSILLPLWNYESYESFKLSMDEGIINSLPAILLD
ncbi:G2/M phase-specific E3 ubiquitin-protein ligase [Lingula anatina]|uniref:G2/M phase-specific E3 ubiquitin-protein ligase n=1 Tax=Lingula anatina TaxID=7574 RepID=A0A1S3HCP5_LINAN|nr:G2/M phase-specific E3 ubiquitin-protein ligase [Lingula anatina]XP_013383755.1 G2/M phase-specific E3 ubiquitin-protein ligase [Lingula anatina]|eukprot:XP_013383754.1 G2/M phase-specific E3 ubiquitin-protein ligase [Lingula anatina]